MISVQCEYIAQWFASRYLVMLFGQAQGDNILLLAVTLLFGLLAICLSSDAVPPFDYVKYAT